jgi:septum formation inhibitor-activating ATPase MinD/FixJ family two-component response regulator
MEGTKLKVYIVDIEETTISRLEELFYNNPDFGIKVIGYSHNYNACINDFNRARNADLFLISAYLPDTMGTELISPIKKLNPNAKILITLQKNTRNLAEASLSKGANDYIQKPFKARQLIDKMIEVTGFSPGDPQDDGYDHNKSYDQPNLTENRLDKSSNSYDDIYLNQDISSLNKEPSLNLSADNEVGEIYQHSDKVNTYTDDFTNNQQSRRALFDVYSENPITPSTRNETVLPHDGEKPNIVCSFSSAGSNGKTTMLVNAAVTIHKHSEYNPKICIVDFNLLFPSVLYKFHQDDLILCKRNIFDLCEDINNLDENLINQALVTHEPTGIKILDTPSDIVRDLSRVNPDTIQQLIAHLRDMFDLVLIDTSSNIRDDASSFPLTVADKGIVLLEPDLGNLLHTRKLISMFKMFENNLPERIIPKLEFILNKENPKAIIHVDTIKKTLFNTDVNITIPEDNTITHLSNNGQFVIEHNSPATRSIKELARTIYPFDKNNPLDGNSPHSKNNKKGLGFLSSIFRKK